jgi:hypothetical protein
MVVIAEIARGSEAIGMMIVKISTRIAPTPEGRVEEPPPTIATTLAPSTTSITKTTTIHRPSTTRIVGSLRWARP